MDLQTLGMLAQLVRRAIESDAAAIRLLVIILGLALCGVLLQRSGS